MTLNKFDDWSKEEKIIFFIFLSDYGDNDQKWRNYLARFLQEVKPNINWWVEPQFGNNYGLGLVGIFDFNDMSDAEEVCDTIMELYKNDVLIVISNGLVRNYSPIVKNEDEAFVKPKKLFDNLTKKKAKGVYILNQ